MWDKMTQPIDLKKSDGIFSKDHQPVLVQPLCGLLNQSKFVPPSYLQSLVLELGLVDNAADPVMKSTGTKVPTATAPCY